MRVIQCSMCQRRAAWLIDRELFCEGHKEVIIQEAGVDRFRIWRLTDAERAFRGGGRYSWSTARKKGGDKGGGQSHSNSPEPLIYSIPLKLAVYCENCETISNSRPHRCGVCDSEAVLRVEPILNRHPDPPADAPHRSKLFLVRAVGA